jgi:formylglycine-generating enzyme required for sulfatase activity
MNAPEPWPSTAQVAARAAEVAHAAADWDGQRDGGVAPALLQQAVVHRERVAYRDHPDIMRSWPLHMATPLGNWFEQLPIEVVPPPPGGPMPDSLREETRNSIEKWTAGSALHTDAVFGTLLDPETFRLAGPVERRHRLWLTFGLLTLDPRPWTRGSLYDRPPPAHPDVAARCLILSLAYIDLPWPAAERYVYALTHDTDEPAFITAFRICARRHDERAMDHLRPIVRSPAAVLKELASNRMHYPVGHAAGSICCAELAILGTDDPEAAAEREKEMTERIRRPLSEPVELVREQLAERIEHFEPPPGPGTDPPAGIAEMVEIPAGPVALGVTEAEAADEAFDWSTCYPPRQAHVPTYYMDKYPVTNAQYDAWAREFAELPAELRRAHEHPGQRAGKPHERNTRDDARYGPTHPVVGIDWFDAWAYARFHGKELPTEVEWEKAARGPESRRYPWGDHFHRGAARYAGETYGEDPVDMVHWIRLLTAGTHSTPETTTAPVDAHPDGISGYGVWDMCGNCWEYTTIAFFTGQVVRPAFAEFTPIQLMGSREGHVVIRGGAWSSPASLVSAPYRGYDLMTDRHSEIGFRCIWRPEEQSTEEVG